MCSFLIDSSQNAASTFFYGVVTHASELLLTLGNSPTSREAGFPEADFWTTIGR